MIDWTRLRDLRDEVGAEEFEDIVILFMDEVDGTIEKLKSDFDAETLEDDLHFLKGSALTLGFRELSDLCQDGETEALQGRAKTVDVAGILKAYQTSKHIFLSDRAAHMAG
jgi:histidine phosphotransfer protein HptB